VNVQENGRVDEPRKITGAWANLRKRGAWVNLKKKFALAAANLRKKLPALGSSNTSGKLSSVRVFG
jgi:hypothetical protein